MNMAYSHVEYKKKFIKKLKVRIKNLKDRGDNFNAKKAEHHLDRMMSENG